MTAAEQILANAWGADEARQEALQQGFTLRGMPGAAGIEVLGTWTDNSVLIFFPDHVAVVAGKGA